MSIRFYYNETSWRLKSVAAHRAWLNKVIVAENRINEGIGFIFTNDSILKEINIEFLNHDYLTDVITFSYGSYNKLLGEIYISVDTVRENSFLNRVSMEEEFRRVMVHGILHMCGYDDSKEEERESMRKLEDRYLELYKNEFRI
ncbi:MAG: rRNA maturation RNase YbeY [Bacteroidales bacterium]|nr:rRNA maturation RNase YbeY [Bacteroidales bacterium]